MKKPNHSRDKNPGRSATTAFPDPAAIREQAEQKAKNMSLPDFDSMTKAEIQQAFYETRVRQIETELENRHLRQGLEHYADHAELFTAITENILDLVALTDPEGNLEFVGKSHEIFGYERNSLIGENFLNYVHPDDLPRVLDAFKELVGSGAPPRTEYRCRCKDGSYLWIEARGTLLKDENGNLHKILFSSRDVTRREEAERQLQQSEETARQREKKYRLLFDQSPLGVFHIDENGVILSCNDNFARIIGSPREALVGLDMNALPDRKLVTEMQKALAGGTGFYKDTYHSVTAKKSTPGKVYFSPLTSDEGIVIGVTGIVEDITEQNRAEEELRRSENYYRAIFETSGTAIMIIEQDTRISHVNSHFEEIFGYSKQEAEGNKCWTEFLPPGDLEWIKKSHHLRRQDPGAAPSNYEFRFFTRNRELRHGYLTANMIADTTQSVVSIVDITDLKKAEQAIENERSYLSAVIDNIGEAIVICDAEGRISRFNKTARRVHGLPEQPVLPEQWAEHYDLYQQDGITPLPREEIPLFRALQGLPVINEEIVVAPKNSRPYSLVCNGQALTNEQGEVVGAVVGMHDITERKKSEEKLQKNEAFLRAVFESIQDGISVLNNDLTIRYTNSVMQKWYSQSGPLEGQKCYQAYHNRDKPCPNCPSLRCLESGSVEMEEIPGAPYEDSPLKWVELFSFPIKQEGDDKITGLVEYVRDVTERRQAEKEREKLQIQLYQAQKMQSIGRLAGGVAHDFNNKLSIINGYAEMTLDMLEKSDPLYGNIREIYRAGLHSADIVRQLLAFARKQTISPMQIDLNDTVSNLLKMLQRLIGENIDLAWYPGNNLWPVKMDPAQVDQIMANLAVNARDAISDVGKMTIETKNVVFDKDCCQTHAESTPGNYVMLAVSDNGCGMDKEVLDKAFEPFFTTKDIGEGSGLGLPTVYGIVKQNNGFINIYSEPGEGSTVKIYLPGHTSPESVSAPAQKSGKQTPTGSETVLIVEDEPAILQMGKDMLTNLGYTVLTAARPAAALRLAEEYEGEIELLITDVVMPEMNGRDLAAQIHLLQPDIKTIYISGYTEDAIAHHGVLDNGVQFIQKPFSIQDLGLKVREALSQQDI
mgnify:FL=1